MTIVVWNPLPAQRYDDLVSLGCPVPIGQKPGDPVPVRVFRVIEQCFTDGVWNLDLVGDQSHLHGNHLSVEQREVPSLLTMP